MTNEERDIISKFIARVGGAGQQSGFAAGSVPASQPALPPIDRDADSFIAQTFNQYPEARYRITQLAFVQDHALVEAQNRIQRLEWELQQAQQAVQQAQQAGGKPGGGFLSGLFGGGNRQQSAPPQGDPRWGGQQGAPAGQPQQPNYQQPNYQQSAPPPPQYPPNYQQGVLQQRGGSGFLGSALTTAAGVAGGVVAGNALMSLFSPHGGGFGGGLGGGFGGEAGASPWGTPGAGGQDYVDNSSWDQSGAGTDSSWTDNSSNSTDSSWTDNSSNSTDSSWTDNSGGGWDSGGGGSDDTF